MEIEAKKKKVGKAFLLRLEISNRLCLCELPQFLIWLTVAISFFFVFRMQRPVCRTYGAWE